MRRNLYCRNCIVTKGQAAGVSCDTARSSAHDTALGWARRACVGRADGRCRRLGARARGAASARACGAGGAQVSGSRQARTAGERQQARTRADASGARRGERYCSCDTAMLACDTAGPGCDTTGTRYGHCARLGVLSWARFGFWCTLTRFLARFDLLSH